MNLTDPEFLGCVTMLAILALGALIARSTDRRTKERRTAAVTTPGAVRANYGCRTQHCARIPVQKYAGHNYCRDCADQVAWLDHLASQARTAEDVRMWERELKGETA